MCCKPFEMSLARLSGFTSIRWHEKFSFIEGTSETGPEGHWGPSLLFRKCRHIKMPPVFSRTGPCFWGVTCPNHCSSIFPGWSAPCAQSFLLALPPLRNCRRDMKSGGTLTAPQGSRSPRSPPPLLHPRCPLRPCHFPAPGAVSPAAAPGSLWCRTLWWPRHTTWVPDRRRHWTRTAGLLSQGGLWGQRKKDVSGAGRSCLSIFTNAKSHGNECLPRQEANAQSQSRTASLGPSSPTWPSPVIKKERSGTLVYSQYVHVEERTRAEGLRRQPPSV